MPRKPKRPLPCSTRSPSEGPPLKRQRSNTLRSADYVCFARDVIRLRFVSCKQDMLTSDDSDSDADSHEHEFFAPVYTHQLFAKERIIGFKDLSIRIYFSQPHLYSYIEVDYSSKVESADECCDIMSVFRRWIRAGLTTNKSEFLKVTLAALLRCCYVHTVQYETNCSMCEQ